MGIGEWSFAGSYSEGVGSLALMRIGDTGGTPMILWTKIIVRRFDGRIAFVPEGQLKSLSVPQIFVVETEPPAKAVQLLNGFNPPAGTGLFSS